MVQTDHVVAWLKQFSRSKRRHDERSPRECCADGDEGRLPETDEFPRQVHESQTLPLQRGDGGAFWVG